MKYLLNLLKNKDGVIAYLPFGSAFLYAMGGSGCLAIRRYILPIYIVLCLFWVCRKPALALFSIAGGIALSFVFHLGYGQAISDKNILFLALLGCLYGLATLPFWFIYSRKLFKLLFTALIPAWFLWSIAMSSGWLGYQIEWKIAEAGTGFLIGLACLVYIWGRWHEE